MHYHTKASKRLEKLREEPRIQICLPSGGPLRSMIYRFRINPTNNISGGNNIESVYYLSGDERRAVRKFIEENSEFAHEIMQYDNEVNQEEVMHKKLIDNEWFAEIFAQEYEIMKFKGEI